MDKLFICYDEVTASTSRNVNFLQQRHNYKLQRTSEKTSLNDLNCYTAASAQTIFMIQLCHRTVSIENTRNNCLFCTDDDSETRNL